MSLVPDQDADRETFALFPLGLAVSSSADAEQHKRKVGRNGIERTDFKTQIFARQCSRCQNAYAHRKSPEDIAECPSVKVLAVGAMIRN